METTDAEPDGCGGEIWWTVCPVDGCQRDERGRNLVLLLHTAAAQGAIPQVGDQPDLCAALGGTSEPISGSEELLGRTIIYNIQSAGNEYIKNSVTKGHKVYFVC